MATKRLEEFFVGEGNRDAITILVTRGASDQRVREVSYFPVISDVPDSSHSSSRPLNC